ncbi:universal stress protein [Chloroflexota bacterium]
MFNNILVPLDGSELAECAINYAQDLAKRSDAGKIALVSVTEKVTGLTHDSESLERFDASGDAGLAQTDRGVIVTVGKMEKQAQSYLERVAEKLSSEGISVAVEVLIGNPAEQIAKYVEENDFDVVVMSSHGRSGPSRWAHGSVADKVFRTVCIPILMIRAPGCSSGV